jgi:hypothetical protein
MEGYEKIASFFWFGAVVSTATPPLVEGFFTGLLHRYDNSARA